MGCRYPDSRACSTGDTPAAKNGTAIDSPVGQPVPGGALVVLKPCCHGIPAAHRQEVEAYLDHLLAQFSLR
jgi:hypothetical protein